jgi:GT2 family glycosyltransferase
LASAIRSALNQSYRRTEIIVVDDGSTDDSALVLAEFGSQVHGIYQSNQGPNSARNRGYAGTLGDIIFLLTPTTLCIREPWKKSCGDGDLVCQRFNFAFRRSMPMARR